MNEASKKCKDYFEQKYFDNTNDNKMTHYIYIPVAGFVKECISVEYLAQESKLVIKGEMLLSEGKLFNPKYRTFEHEEKIPFTLYNGSVTATITDNILIIACVKKQPIENNFFVKIS